MLRYATLLLLVLLPASSASARVVMIDDFEHPLSMAELIVDETTSLAEDEDTGIPVENVVGGTRLGILEAKDLLFEGEIVRVDVNLPSAPGKLVVNAYCPAHKLTRGKFANGSKTWSGSQMSAKWDDLVAVVFLFDGPPAYMQTISVQLWSQEGTPQEKSPLVTKSLGTSDVSVVFPLSDFTDLDLTDIDGIEITFDDIPGGQSFSLDEIRVIPEPGALSLLAVGLVALARRRLRQ